MSRFDPVRWRDSRAPESGRLVVRHLERMPLGTPYLKVARRVAEVAGRQVLAGKKVLAVDATGMGMRVVEMLVAERSACEVTPVMLTGGVAEHHDGRVWHVPKVNFMAGLKEMLELGELGIARRMGEAGRLVQELMSVTVGVRKSGRVRVRADGEHGIRWWRWRWRFGRGGRGGSGRRWGGCFGE